MLESHRDYIKKICDMMGEDFEDPACLDILQYLNKCPNFKVYYDTVKKTILLCKENDCPEKLPEEVNYRLMKVLNLEEIYRELKSSYKNL